MNMNLSKLERLAIGYLIKAYNCTLIKGVFNIYTSYDNTGVDSELIESGNGLLMMSLDDFYLKYAFGIISHESLKDSFGEDFTYHDIISEMNISSKTKFNKGDINHTLLNLMLRYKDNTLDHLKELYS